MKHRKPLRALVFGAALALLLAPAALVPGPEASAQERDESAEMEELAQTVATATDPHYAWNDSVRLAGFGPKAAPLAQEAAELPEATPQGRVALGRVLLQLEQRGAAAQTLLDVARSDAPVAVRVEALRLLGQTSDEHEDELRALLDSSLDPRIRAAAALSLWSVSKDLYYKDRLKELLRSDDFDIRVEGALALAQVNDFNPEVQAVLNQLRREPTDRGRLADALLQKDEAWRIRVDSARPRPETAPAAGALTGAELAALARDALSRLEGFYVDPEQIDAQKLWEGAARGLVEALGDPHTAYQSLEDRDEWNEHLNKEYGGIGAYVGFDQDDFFTVTRPMFGGPAWNAELKEGTRVLRVDDWDTGGQEINEIVKRLRGEPGTTVRLQVQRPGWKEPREMSLVRGFITVPTVYADLLPGRVGYVLVDNFGAKTAEELWKELEDLQRRGAESLVLDLRFNSGGYLAVAQEIADRLLPKGKLVVETKGRAFRQPPYFTQGRSSEWSRTVPLAVLVNEFSASASEILSAALKLHGRARIVGVRTFGKGSVQSVFPVYTPPFSESFTDRNGNGAWDDAEEFDDRNRNGVRDPDEPFRDQDRNGRFTEAEPFVDRNGNGRFDAPGVKITIARYFVSRTPGAFEFNPSRKEMFVSGRRVWLGGLEPDVPVAADEFEGWRNEAIAVLEERKVFEDYLKKWFERDEKRMLDLALADPRTPEAYPEFEQLYASLGETRLSREDVWYWLHVKLRNHASNRLGRLLVGDWAVDVQLQRAIRDLADRAGGPAASAPEYEFIRNTEFEVPPTYDPVALSRARPVK